MISELRRTQDFVQLFAQNWSAAPHGSTEREINRRNCLAAIILEARQAQKEVAGTGSEAAFVVSSLHVVLDNPLWRMRERLLFSSIQPTTYHEPPLYEPVELLRALQANDGRFQHNLDVPVP